MKYFLIIAAFTFSILSACAYEFQPLGFESTAMGGAGVASACGCMAGYYNPALLTKSTYPVEWDLGAGAAISEHNLASNIDTLHKANLTQTVSDIQSAITSSNGALPAISAQDRQNIIDSLAALKQIGTDNGLAVMPQVTFGLQIEHFSIGVYGTSDACAQAHIVPTNTQLYFKTDGQNVTINNVPLSGVTLYYSYDPALSTYSYNAFMGGSQIPGLQDWGSFHYDPSLTESTYEQNSLEYALNSKKTYLQLRGLALAEVPVSYARKFHTTAGNLSLGGSAKLMEGMTYDQQVNIDTNSNTVQTDLTTHPHNSSALGFDLGMTFEPYSVRGLTLGLVEKDLNSPKFATDTGTNYVVKPMTRVGVDYNCFHKMIDIAADYDVTRNTTISGDGSQYLGGGINFHPASWFSLRGGAMENLADNGAEGPILTAGFGFGLKWAQINLAAAMATKTGSFEGNSIPRYSNVNLAFVSKW